MVDDFPTSQSHVSFGACFGHEDGCLLCLKASFLRPRSSCNMHCVMGKGSQGGSETGTMHMSFDCFKYADERFANRHSGTLYVVCYKHINMY
jgi:hypothetical protein